MNAIILNDTRSDKHIGCELVMHNTLTHCKKHGIKIIKTIPTADSLNASDLISPHLAHCDIIILNGEGTLHHDRKRALALLEATTKAKHAGLKTVLFNALWERNPRGLSHLPQFDLIFCRDSKSTSEILENHPNLPVSTVADMVFATSLCESTTSNLTLGKSTLVSDSIKKQKNINLAKFAILHRLPFSPMGKSFSQQLKTNRILKWKLRKNCGYNNDKLDTPEEFMSRIMSSNGVITGRFHTACLALLLERPVFCISSNSRKIEALYEDFGLSPCKIPQTTDDLEIPFSQNAQWREQNLQRAVINKHILRTLQQIDLMFQKIAQL